MGALVLNGLKERILLCTISLELGSFWVKELLKTGKHLMRLLST